MSDSSPPDPAIPRQSKFLFHWFRRYCFRYTARHFHALRLSKSSARLPKCDGVPLIFVMNHPSWWDIIVGFVLSDRFKQYRHYAPIEAEMLPKYRMFQRLGMFGVDATPRGAARFLRTTKAIFEGDYRALWITAQGKFVDVRERPIQLRPGVGFVASRLERGYIIPIAVEYSFWEERTPEALIRFGEALDLEAGKGCDGREWTSLIEKALTEAQDGLARESMARDATAFETLVQGKVGVGGIYDTWRRLKAWLSGKKFIAAHGESTSDPVSQPALERA